MRAAGKNRLPLHIVGDMRIMPPRRVPEMALSR